MYTNIDTTLLASLCDREPEVRLVIETMLENHKRILGTVSHEIRNPLTLLYGNLQLLEQDIPELSKNRLWQNAVEEFHYTNNLLDELSQFNNGANICIEECDGGYLFENIAQSFAQTLSSDTPSFVYHIGDIGHIFIDAQKCKQVLLNLFKNAKEACSSSDCIKLDCTIEGASLHIIVEDDGIGISEDLLSQIFDPFVTHKVGGTGLGLAICREIIHAHDGTITVQSTLGKGSRFHIVLPVE